MFQSFLSAPEDLKDLGTQVFLAILFVQLDQAVPETLGSRLTLECHWLLADQWDLQSTLRGFVPFHWSRASKIHRKIRPENISSTHLAVRLFQEDLTALGSLGLRAVRWVQGIQTDQQYQ